MHSAKEVKNWPKKQNKINLIVFRYQNVREEERKRKFDE